MKKIYIAGPMTGLPEFNKPAFFNMEHDYAKDIGLEIIYEC
ncbi:TPA: DUF4406 domain-containing protein [Vibrio cholerae]